MSRPEDGFGREKAFLNSIVPFALLNSLAPSKKAPLSDFMQVTMGRLAEKLREPESYKAGDDPDKMPF